VKLVSTLVLLLLLGCSSGDVTGSGGEGGAGASGDAGSGGAPGTGGDAGAGGAGGAAGSSGTSGTGGGTAVSARVVFVTSGSHGGDLGGLDGADALCASEAAAAGLTGEFKAWLSTIDTPVSDRFVRSDVPYVRVDGTRIADDWADLTDGQIQAIINLDATATAQGGDVWTGTLSSGLSYTTSDCAGFTDGTIGTTGLCGTTQSINNWTFRGAPTCNTQLRLFCFEQ